MMLVFNSLAMNTIILSIFMAVTSSSWIQVWMALELNMLAFIPIMYNNSSKTITSMMKYFFVQAIASSIFLLAIMISIIYNSSMAQLIIVFSMFTKLGMFPMFAWFPQVASSLTWLKLIILMTVQKIIPLNVLCYINEQSLIFWMTIMSCFVSFMGLWSQLSLKKLMSYSSINHLCWMMVSVIAKTPSWLIYILLYSVVSTILFLIFNQLNINSLPQLNFSSNSPLSMNILLSLWSMGGLPPLMGFLPKWQMISEMLVSMMPLMMILILSSLISISVYTFIMYPIMMKKMNKMNLLNNSMTLNSFNILGLLPLLPLMLL